MPLLTQALWATVAAGFLAGCSGGLSTPSSSAPVGTQANQLVSADFIPGPQLVLDRITPEKHKKSAVVGVYASEYFAGVINGYKGTNPKNNPPTCTLTGSYVNDIAVDGKGNLIDPDGGTHDIIVYKGPKLCGPKLGTISDSYGTPDDAASLNAATGNIVVSSGFSISVCSLKRGCYENLKGPSTYEIAGVALAKNGDCWASGVSSANTSALIYFKGCSGSGKIASGWKNTYYGGLDIDTRGNLIAIDALTGSTPRLWVYSGCNPACNVVGGPFPLHGYSIFGHLNSRATGFVVGDFQNGELDLYKYTTSALTYEYSISSGLTFADDVVGAAFDPASKQ
jgi:hypothetical protein